MTQDQIKLIKSILKENCSYSKTVSFNKVFNLFEKKMKSGMEDYRFKRALSDLIKQGVISGYQTRVGRNGGIAKTEPMEKVKVICSRGEYVGHISKHKLSEFLTTILAKTNSNQQTNKQIK